MQMANTVCEVAVASGAGAVGPLPAAPPAAQCYDRDKQVSFTYYYYNLCYCFSIIKKNQ